MMLKKSLQYEICVILVLLLCTPTDSSAQKRFAKPNDGVKLNQPFIPLADGTSYAAQERKVLKPEIVRTPEETEMFRRQVIERLNFFRYWAEGAPPEKSALERYLEREKKAKEAQVFYGCLLKENWFRMGLFSEKAYPYEDKGPYGRP